MTALKARLSAMPGRLAREAGAALAQGGDVLAEEARRRLASEPGSGPSVPGAPPRDGKHRLADAIAVRPHGADPGVTVAVGTPLARFLEYGTRRMAARPFLRPAAEAVREGVRARCRAALRRAALARASQGREDGA